MSAFQFQVDLRSMIELLSSHLYSGPEVFVREVLQNGVDAVRAREQFEPGFRGKIHIELTRLDEGAVLSIEDDGIGLTLEEVHKFLATIGSSSKRQSLENYREDYIGQFGIGLLSCFIVTDEIVLVSQSAQPGAIAVEWKGKADGTYVVRELETKRSVGSKVYLKSNMKSAALFRFETILAHARRYGSLLSIPITVVEGTLTGKVNITPPWLTKYGSKSDEQEGYMSYGKEIFDMAFLDYFRLHETGMDGVAYVLPFSPSPSAQRSNRVYLKEMLISENANNLLPEWAFFVKCVINTNKLKPTASREALYEDKELERLRERLGEMFKDYVVRLSRGDRQLFDRFIQYHSLAIKQLASYDDDFLLVFIDHIPFQTTLGTRTLRECAERSKERFYVSSIDEYQQVADIASAQGLCLINAGYVYETPLLERYLTLRPDEALKKIQVAQVIDRLGDLSVKEREGFFDFLQLAERILRAQKVKVSIKSFSPEDLPVVFVESKTSSIMRSVERVGEGLDDHWKSMLGSVFSGMDPDYPELCFNSRNALVQKLAAMASGDSAMKLKEILEVLYVQALLLSRRPVTQRELGLLNNGIIKLLHYIPA